MSATVTLTPVLRSRLAAVRRRARLLRVVRGGSGLILALGLLGGGALLADYCLDLPAAVREYLLWAWIGVGISWLLLGVVWPLRRRLDARALAAVIEQKYPDLGERLTSCVELAGTIGRGHGSPTFIALLIDETERQSKQLNFRSSLPARRAGVFAALAAVVVLSAAVPAVIWQQEYTYHTQRFVHPWSTTSTASYSLEVTSGDLVAGRGRTVTLSAHLVPGNDMVVLPERGALVLVDADGNETRQEIESDGKDAFTIAYKVAANVSYRFEAGEAISDSHRITAVTPVELAAESPRITLTPPAYARATKDEETYYGLVDLSVLQHSAVRFDFRFTRPAEAAYLEWTAEEKPGENGAPPTAKTSSHPLTLGDDRLAATFTLPATSAGKYRLVLEAEHGIQTVLEGGTITVQPDQPPSVVKFAGKEDMRNVQASEGVPLHLEVADDIAVIGVDLEYRINEGPAVRRPMTLQGVATPAALARLFLDLAGKVQAEDRVHYRFYIRDNLPKEYDGPHVVIYPPERWLSFQVARGSADTQKDILAQRDEIHRKLDAIKKALLKEKSGVFKVQQETQNQVTLPAEQAERIKGLQQDNQNSAKALRGLAQNADAEPMLQPIAEMARSVADREMQASQQALEQAPQQTSPRERNRRFEKVDQQLASAVKRLEAMKKVNDRLAQERLDQVGLEMLAQRERQLAEQAAELADKNPSLDPRAKEQADKLRQQQAEIAAQLEQTTQKNKALKEALEQARQEQIRQMAERARQLAQAQRDLMRAQAETRRQHSAEQSAELTRQQQELAKQAAELTQETRPPAQAAQTDPLKADEAQRAAEALQQGDQQEAIKHQEKAAAELERLAQAFERAVKLSADPREAARQLAQAEKALGQRVREEMARPDARQPLAQRLKPLQDEQNAIQRAAERLSVPPNRPEANEAKRQIAERAAQAAEAIRKQDAPRAQAEIDETRKMLNRLADLLPDLEKRRQQAQQEVARLRQQQEEIARQAEQIKKDDPDAPHRLAEAARRQAETAEALSKMDAPNQEARQERTAEALNRALADLMDGRRADVPASQREARRQLERLEQALRGQQPADEQARNLARQQRELAQETARAAADPQTTPQQKQELQDKQQQIAEQAGNLAAPEAPQRQREAAEATRRAARAAQAQPTAPQTHKQMEEAARKLEELAQQLAGQEGDAARAERLASRQAEAAAQSEGEAGKASTAEAQRRQEEIAREARDLRAGEQAEQEKQRALDALARAQQAPANERADAQRQAADALRDLADQLAGRKDAAARANELARQQRELAGEVARMEPNESAPEQAKKAADRQAELARQLRRLDAKDAPPEAQEAGAKMAEAAKALAEASSPAEARQAVAQATQAAQKLAEQLGQAQAAKNSPPSSSRTTSAKAAEQSPRQTAKQLAEKQRAIAKATQQAREEEKRRPKQESEKAKKEIARQQRQLNQEASRLPANQSQRRLEQARAAMNEAEQDLERQDTDKARQKQTEAADALEQLAEQLPAQAPQTRRQDEQDTPSTMPRSLPNQRQIQKARQLARQQRQLRDAVQNGSGSNRAAAGGKADNPVGDLAHRQNEIARSADQLARDISQEHGEESPPSQRAQRVQRAARETARYIEAGALKRALEEGQRSAEHLRQLAAQLARMPRNVAPDAPDLIRETRQLGLRQDEINHRLRVLVRDPLAAAIQQQAQQQSLQQQAANLMRELNRMAQQVKDPAQAQSLQQASRASQQAQQAMQQSSGQDKQGRSDAARTAQEQAAQSLDRAARQTSQSAGSSGDKGPPTPSSKPRSPAANPQAAQSVQQARQDMDRARDQLAQGQPGQAQSSMRQAAQSLARAAQQMAAGKPQPNQPGQDGSTPSLGRAPVGLPDLNAFGLDKTPHAGKSWGELPGELRTKIVQDMKARYGEDYARMIKLYFEQLAATGSQGNAAPPPASPSLKK